MEEAVIEYLSYLNIPISESYCKKCIVSHPDYPSLLSIADTLERLGIDHQIGKIEKKDMDELPVPCVLHHDKQGGGLLFVKDSYDLDSNNPYLEGWDGIVVKAKSTNSIADQEHNELYKREKLQKKFTLFLGIVLLGIFLLAAIQGDSGLFLALLSTSIIGALVGYLLLAKDMGITYKPVETFCKVGLKTNCDHIISSNGAKLFSGLTLTDAAASYFAFQLVILSLFIPVAEDSAPFLWGLSASAYFTIPVIGYSLYYQFFKVKAWCRLCVVIDIILGLQIVLFAQMYFKEIFTLDSFALVPILILTILFCVIASSIILLKNKLKTADESHSTEIVAKRVKHDPEVFTQQLLKEEQVDVTPLESEMRLGNDNALINIMMILNLHCHPCRRAFKKIEQILDSYPNKVGIAIRLTKGLENLMGELPTTTYFIRYWNQFISGSSDEFKRTRKYFSNWYETMDPETFTDHYPAVDKLEKEIENSINKLETHHYNWVKKYDVKRTPTLFINGYELPKDYMIRDFMALTPSLANLWVERDFFTNNRNELKTV